MRPGFLNQKLGKRNTRRAALQRAKAELNKIPGMPGCSAGSRKTEPVEHGRGKAG